MLRRHFLKAVGLLPVIGPALLAKASEPDTMIWDKGTGTITLSGDPVLCWVARDGRWDDPQSWSDRRDGPGGAGVPDARTNVDIYVEGTITIRTEGCDHPVADSMYVSGDGHINFDSGPAISLGGGVDIDGPGSMVLE